MSTMLASLDRYRAFVDCGGYDLKGCQLEVVQYIIHYMQEIWFEGYGPMGYFVGLYGALRHKAAICHQWQIFSWQNWQEAIIMQCCKGKFSFDTNIFYLQQEIVRCQGGRSWSLNVRCLSESRDPQFLVNSKFIAPGNTQLRRV